MSTPAQNNFKVAKDQWAKWNRQERTLFNDLMRSLQQHYVNREPSTVTLTKRQWRTIVWNAAWLAADDLRARRLKALDKAAKKAKHGR